jgi:hypothetical protein
LQWFALAKRTMEQENPEGNYMTKWFSQAPKDRAEERVLKLKKKKKLNSVALAHE